MYKPKEAKLFGAALKRLLHEKELSDRQFAKQAGLPHSHVSKILNPKPGKEIAEPRKKTRQQLAQGLGITEQELLEQIARYSDSEAEKTISAPPGLAESEEAIAKPHRESTEAIDASANGLSCKEEVDYRCYRLWELLAASQWLQADRETLDILLKVSGREKERWLRVEDIQKISCQVLRTIDQLWVEYSQKRFGFSVQQKLIRLSRGDTDIETWLQFALRVGWHKNNNLWLTWLEIEAKRFSLGGNIAELFPVGFLPYQYSFGSKIHRGAIGDWREPSPVSAFLLLHRDF